MENIYTVYYKNETGLVNRFCEEFEYSLYEEPGFGQKWGFGDDIQNPDIYFHSGTVKSSDLELMMKSKKIIVNSNTIKSQIVAKSNSMITNDQIDVIYPTTKVLKFKKKTFKEAFKNIHNIDKKTKLIYFTAKNFEKTGVIQFLKILQNLTATNFKGVISATPEQLKALVPILKDMNLSNKVVLAQGDIFRASDIFVLPTSNKLFASNILRAMSCKCVVFVPQTNHSFEIVDNFSIMNSVDDPSIIHKIDMLLQNPDEIKAIQKQNFKKAKEFTINEQYNKLKLALKI